jgi:peptide/nickel transport system ATP-binding protein/oligopeptide transport system ATP-binding protein
MQMIFQEPYLPLIPSRRSDSLLREVGKVYKMGRSATEAKIRRLFEYISLPEDDLTRSPGELSGGQLQRLAIARALILDPSFIVADEPVSALDVSVQAQILNLIADLREQMQMTLLFISHEMTVVEHICDTVAVMYLGKVVELAPKEELFQNLLHPYTQALMSAIPKADPDHSAERIVLRGDIPNAIDLPQGCRFASRCRHCMDICGRQEPSLQDVGNGHRVACHRVVSGSS